MTRLSNGSVTLGSGSINRHQSSQAARPAATPRPSWQETVRLMADISKTVSGIAEAVGRHPDDVREVLARAGWVVDQGKLVFHKE